MGVALSVVVGTTQPWPEVRATLDAFFDEARELEAEVILLDRDGCGLPEDAVARYPGIVHLTEPGASIYRLREVGMSVARGDVVALTEDHCHPGPGWLARHLAAHREHPEAAVVGGPVANGATRRVLDWAIYLLNHAPWAPPQGSGERGDVDRANISYKRRVLPSEPSPAGRDEPFLDAGLRERGERFWLDGANVIVHEQSLGVRGTLSIVYHVGRAVYGLRIQRGMSWRERLIRLPASPLIAVITIRRIYGAALAHRRYLPARALASLPGVAVLATLVSLGFLVGYATGHPGGSAAHIR